MDDMVSKFIDKYSQFGLDILDALIIFIIGWYVSKLIIHFLVKVMKKSNVDPIVINFVKSIANVGLKVIVIITAISKLGVPTTSLVTVLATAGAAIVLGLKDSMTGVVSGIIILFAKPFVKGDTIEVNNYIGKIQEIQLLYTILMTFDNKMVVIPNNELASSTFVNYSHEDVRRVDMIMNIHYDNDIELAKKLIMDVVLRHPYTMKSPEPYVRVGEYKDHSIAISIRVWTKTEQYYDLRDDLLEQIKESFDKEGITIPYNQLDILLHDKEKS